MKIYCLSHTALGGGGGASNLKVEGLSEATGLPLEIECPKVVLQESGGHSWRDPGLRALLPWVPRLQSR